MRCVVCHGWWQFARRLILLLFERRAQVMAAIRQFPIDCHLMSPDWLVPDPVCSGLFRSVPVDPACHGRCDPRMSQRDADEHGFGYQPHAERLFDAVTDRPGEFRDIRSARRTAIGQCERV